MGKKRSHRRHAPHPVRQDRNGNDVDALMKAAIALHEQGDLDKAEAAYRRVLEVAENHGNALNNLAIILKQTRRLDEAVATYERAAQVMDDPVPAHNNLALAYFAQRRFPEAVKACQRVLCLNPADASAFFNLGNILREVQHNAPARLAYERCVQAAPDNAGGYANLGNLLKIMGYFTESIVASKKAAELLPGLMEPYANIADALREHGYIKESIPYFAQALANNPKHSMAHSNLLMALNYAGGRTGQENLKAHLYWAQVHADALMPDRPVPAADRAPDRRLRVGFVSGDFRTHSVAYFLLPLIEKLDREGFEPFCFSNTVQPDITTDKFKAAAQWRDVRTADDADLAEAVRADGIDILVDVSGHTGNNRLLTFARKPAPVQVSWLGYPNTTGLRVMDYRLTDAVADPVGVTDPFHTESLVRLPGGFLCYRPLDLAPPVEALPARTRGYVTFGSFNNISKVGPEVIALWSAVLKAVPNSRILLKHFVLGADKTKERYLGLFAENGIDAARVSLLPRIESARGHFAAYHEVDIGLDPFPYNGTTTTCEALWMGVPVVALLGDQHLSRVGASILTQVGASDLVAASEQDYVAICRRLAGNLPLLADMRRSMRQRLEASPLRDEDGFARAVGLAFREMWRRHCFAAAVPAEAV